MAIKQLIRLTALFLTASFLGAFPPANARQPHINVIQIKDTINPGVDQFVQSAISLSANDRAEFLIILLDTPGGLLTSMRAICQSILNSPIPVVVYVYPAGARAASAGVFITEAADIAAMAPGANIGAAHPVSGAGGSLSATMNEKILNDTLAFARSIAYQRGRNEQWFQDAVGKSVSASAQEAFKLNVIDLVADNLPSLLTKLDGWRLRRADTTVVLKTAGVDLRTIAPTLQDRVLQIVGNPDLAYLLLMIGLAGLYFELSRPGAIIPGVVGGISLVLALYGFQTLPVDYAGFLIILLALLFFILEMKILSHGAFTLAGLACLVIGSLMLFKNPADRVGLSVLLPTVGTLTFFFAVVARLAIRAQTARPETGLEALPGMIGKAVMDIDPEGKVFVNGELWHAQSEEPIEKGETVEVLEVHNLKLKVKRIDGRK
jgi:membrane-bound serine protease (ClpP class)